MGNNEPLVSVIIPTYKNTNTLCRAIDSVLRQSYQNIEIIVVDDNDRFSEYRKETEIIVSRYTLENNVRYIKNERNMERSFTRNHGARESTGEYIAFLDNDDEFVENKISSQIECLLGKGTEYAFCYSNYVRKKDGSVVAKCKEKREGNLQLASLMRNLFIHPGSNLLIRKDAFFEVGGFDETISVNEDMDLIIKLFERYKIAYSDELGLIVNLHDEPIKDFNFEKVTSDFYNHELKTIKTYSIAAQTKIMKMHGLQIMRFNLKNPREIICLSTKYKIGPFLLLKYLMYLIYRKMSKNVICFQI